MPLDQRQREFAHRYAATGEGRQSAIAAGYAPKSAAARACELLRRPEVVGVVLREREKLGLPTHELRVGLREFRPKSTSAASTRSRKPLHWDDPANDHESGEEA